MFAQLIHEGDWDPDPSAVHNLLKYARDNSTMDVKFKRENVQLKDPKAADYPLLVHHRPPRFRLDRRGGGRAAAVSEGGRAAAGRRLLRPAGLRRRLPPRDRQGPARPASSNASRRIIRFTTAHYDIKQVDYTPRVREDFGRSTRRSWKASRIDGRLAVVYSRFDLGNGWEQFPHAYSYGLKDESALQIGTNVLVYAVTH